MKCIEWWWTKITYFLIAFSFPIVLYCSQQIALSALKNTRFLIDEEILWRKLQQDKKNVSLSLARAHMILQLSGLVSLKLCKIKFLLYIFTPTPIKQSTRASLFFCAFSLNKKQTKLNNSYISRKRSLQSYTSRTFEVSVRAIEKKATNYIIKDSL